MNIFHEKFQSGQVVAAAGITNAALQTWIRRGLIVGHGDQGVDMPGKPGIRRAFSFFNLMEIATAAALVEAGAQLADAFRAAHHFAHGASASRLPSLPFPGEVGTILALAGERVAVAPWKAGSDFYSEVRSHLGWPDAITLLDMQPLFDRVTTALGHHPEEICELAYSGTNAEEPGID